MFATMLGDRFGQSVALTDSALGKILGLGTATKAGTSVSESKALGVSSIFAAVRTMSMIKASLPLHVYSAGNGYSERAMDHPLEKILHSKPNKYQTSYAFRHLLNVHQYTWGAGVAEIEFDGAGQPVGLWPIPPWLVTPMYTADWKPVYQINFPRGGTKVLFPYQVLVFPFFQTEAHGWVSPVQLHRETIGSELATREFGARTFGQGVNPAGVISGVELGDEESEKALRNRFANYEGLGESHRLMLLNEGQEFKRVGLPPEDSQFLETRRFNVGEIARIYNIPLHLLHETEKSTSWGSGISEQVRGLIKFNLAPECTMWEQEINSKLFFDNHFCEHSMAGMLRGSLEERLNAYEAGQRTGLYSINEMRNLENLPPVEDGDKRLISQNLKELSEVEDAEN